MNRIYQGRVCDAEIADGKNWKPFAAEPKAARAAWERALWEHHELFQDAVNYYVVCLLALAQPGNKIWLTREKLDAKNEAGGDDELMVWRSFRRRGAMRSGLRDSVAKYITPGNDTPTPEQCFAAVLAGNDCAQNEEGRKLLDAGLTQLLGKCTGAAGCKQAAPMFLPRFAKPTYQGSYGEDTSTLAREDEGARLPFVLHDAVTRPDSPALDAFGVHSIALPNEKKPKFIGAEAVKKLRGMVADWRERQPANEDDWQRLEVAIGKLPEEFEMPGYAATSAKNEVKFRLFAMFLFRYVEQSDFTLGLLRDMTKKPEPAEKPPEAKSAVAGAGDPIRTARGVRGYVFRAFTSLPCWGGDCKATPEWIGFDFAAFEEALKALHQVDSKTDERRKAREQKVAQLEYQRGRTKKWKGGDAGEDERRPDILAGDPRIARLEQLVDVELKAEYEMSEGVEVEYGLHPRTIRGFRDIQKKWNAEVKPEDSYSDVLRKKLWERLTDYKKENAETMGSPMLFDELVKEQNWVLWREPSAEQLAEWRKEARLPDDAEFTKDPLQALTDERELKGEIKRLEDPIRFTPADPEHSRRQFYFSDVSAIDKKNRLRHDRQTLDAEVAVSIDGKWVVKWVRIHFTAPRLLRDQLNSANGADALWQQAMMAALGLKTGLTKTEKGKVREATFAECTAVALMPEITASRQRRILLNFPLTLDGEAIAAQLGKAARWDALQFGGADKESYWLRWPATWIDEKKARKKSPPKPWWTSAEPFRCLSVDLGQRDAGAFSLLEVSTGDAPKKQSRKIGTADGKPWWATVRATGMLRLPGEDALVMRDEKWQEELSGKRGRSLVAGEWEEACDICTKLGFDPVKLMGSDRSRHSFPELNRELLYALRRAQARLARLQSWSCVAHEETEEKKRAAFEKRRTRIQEQIAEAIATRAAEEKKDAKERGQELPERSAWMGEAESFVSKRAWDCVRDCIVREIVKERDSIQRELLRVADRIQPLRGRQWEWAKRDDSSQCHVLRQTARGTDERKKMLAGQRGLSMSRIEQLESLRQRCQSLNRALMQEPGKPANLGRSNRGIELPDPCPELLDRLDALKDQRVNQTAHLILAQALGVRLRAHAKSAAERKQQDIHGEYERIPGREPVDFLVLENLDRYLAAQGRSRSENSRLMKWCHRAILGKLKQLCEPYGLRVLETPAAYSSKFCSLTGIVGFRAVELNPDDGGDFRWRKHIERLNDPERAAKLKGDERAESEAVKRLFGQLNELNQDLIAERDKARAEGRPFRPKWRTLLAPQQLGPIFVPMHGNPMQADINAAINLGLRAIAAPDADEIHLRLRAARNGETFIVRAENARERARWKDGVPEIAVGKETDRKKLLTDARLNFFFDHGSVATFDHATIKNIRIPVASSRGLFGTVNQGDWQRVKDINRVRFQKAEREGDDVTM
jgi:hypothetical protein